MRIIYQTVQKSDASLLEKIPLKFRSLPLRAQIWRPPILTACYAKNVEYFWYIFFISIIILNIKWSSKTRSKFITHMDTVPSHKIKS